MYSAVYTDCTYVYGPLKPVAYASQATASNYKVRTLTTALKIEAKLAIFLHTYLKWTLEWYFVIMADLLALILLVSMILGFLIIVTEEFS